MDTFSNGKLDAVSLCALLIRCARMNLVIPFASGIYGYFSTEHVGFVFSVAFFCIVTYVTKMLIYTLYGVD